MWLSDANSASGTTALFEDEASIGTFYQRFAHATMDKRETRDLLFDYFVAKIFVGPADMTIVSWFFEGGPDISFADLAEAKKTAEVLNIEFDTSLSGVRPRRGLSHLRWLRA